MTDTFKKLINIIAGQVAPGRLHTSADTVREILRTLRDPTEDVTNAQSYVDGEWSRRNVEAYIDAVLAD